MYSRLLVKTAKNDDKNSWQIKTSKNRCEPFARLARIFGFEQLRARLIVGGKCERFVGGCSGDASAARLLVFVLKAVASTNANSAQILRRCYNARIASFSGGSGGGGGGGGGGGSSSCGCGDRRC